MKRRLLKYVVVGFTAVVLAGLWAFSTFLFNPFEGAYEYDLSTLIPREVDFYASKAGLRRDFDPLPWPAFADDFAASEGGQALLETKLARELTGKYDVEGAVVQIEAELAKLPLHVDPLEVFGGEDVALAGFFQGRAAKDANWAVYGRANWLGKLALEIVRSGAIDLSAQGITKADVDHGFSLTGGPLPRTLYFTRLRDVIVVATTAELVEKAHELDAGRGENSFGLSAKYADSIANLEQEGDELEAFVDYRAMSENLRLPGTWPDPRDANVGKALAGRLFQVGSVRELMATVEFENGLTFHVNGQLSSEYMSQVQRRLYRLRGMEKEEVLELASMAPPDVGLFVCGRAPIGDMLRETLAVSDPAAVTNLEDLVRNVWGYPDIGPLIDDLDGAFDDDFAFFLRENDYPADESEDAPLHDDTPVPAWALALRVDDRATVEALRQKIVSNQSLIGIRGRTPGSRGVFENKVEGGAILYEYHHPLVAGTGHLATIEMAGPTGTYFVLSNSHQLLGSVFVTYRREDRRGLSENEWFQTLVNTGLASADLVLWLNPRAVEKTARGMAAFAAQRDVTLVVDWSVERPRLEQEVLKANFPGQSKLSLDPESQNAFELLVDQAADRLQAEHLPRLQRQYQRNVDAWMITSGSLFELAIDPKRFHLYGRVVVPFD